MFHLLCGFSSESWSSDSSSNIVYGPSAQRGVRFLLGNISFCVSFRIVHFNQKPSCGAYPDPSKSVSPFSLFSAKPDLCAALSKRFFDRDFMSAFLTYVSIGSGVLDSKDH